MFSSDPSAGAFDLTLFSQSERWADRDGTTYWIHDLSGEEREAIASWLERNVNHFYVQTLERALWQVMLGIESSAPAQLPGQLFMSAREWLASTPLMTALTS